MELSFLPKGIAKIAVEEQCDGNSPQGRDLLTRYRVVTTHCNGTVISGTMRDEQRPRAKADAQQYPERSNANRPLLGSRINTPSLTILYVATPRNIGIE